MRKHREFAPKHVQKANGTLHCIRFVFEKETRQRLLIAAEVTLERKKSMFVLLLRTFFFVTKNFKPFYTFHTKSYYMYICRMSTTETRLFGDDQPNRKPTTDAGKL